VGWHEKCTGDENVYGPAFQSFALPLRTLSIGTFEAERLASGFINRMLIFDIGQGAPIPVDPNYSWSKLPSWLHQALKQIAG